MRPEALDEEMSNVASYSSMLARWKRISEDTIDITTLESKPLRLTVTHEGWEVEHSSSEPYPTFEAALKSESPLFAEKWNNELFRRLQELQDNESSNSESPTS